jgi:protein O-GlcNAc transferase
MPNGLQDRTGRSAATCRRSQSPNHDAHERGAFRNFGIILGKLGKPKQALEQFDRALALNPTARSTWISRGQLLGDKGRYDRAPSDFDQAILLAPDHRDAFQGKGKVLGELKRHDEAFAAYDQALASKA